MMLQYTCGHVWRFKNEAFTYSCMLNQNSVEMVSIDTPHLSSPIFMFAWNVVELTWKP